MKRTINRCSRGLIYLLSLILRMIFPIHRGRVLLWATMGKDYGDNPMYISKYLAEKESSFDVWWMFLRGTNIDKLGVNEKHVWYGSLKYLYILNTSEFIITNHRTEPGFFFWKKRAGQKYIMTWHGSMPIKMVENDAIDSIGAEYVRIAKEDSRICDLMISDSEFFTNLLRKSFWYNGEILKTSIPRNQKFYEKHNFQNIRNKILKFYNEDSIKEKYLVLYAPTFRDNHGAELYIKDWNKIKRTIEDKTQKEVVVLLRLHPNLLNEIDTETLIADDYIKNASIYNDMQELMVAADMLITDYSSTMFEFSMMNKPCFLYMPDRDTYNRGCYFKFPELPFPQSTSVDEFISDIQVYHKESFIGRSKVFIDKYFRLYNPKDGCSAVSEWMKEHSLTKRI